MTTATVPINIRRTPFRATYGDYPYAQFTPLLDDEPALDIDGKPLLDGGRPVIGRPVIGTADRKSDVPTIQFFTVEFNRDGHTERRIVGRALISAPNNALAPCPNPTNPNEVMQFFTEQYVDKDGNLRWARVEGDNTTQTLGRYLPNGEDSLKRKGFKSATREHVLAAMAKGRVNRAEAARLTAANSVSGRDSNLAKILADAQERIQTNVMGNMMAMMTTTMGSMMEKMFERFGVNPNKGDKAKG